MAQMVVRGVRFWYDRDSSGYGSFRTPYAARSQDRPALLEALANWLGLMERVGLKVADIATAGTYTNKPGDHGKGMACDVDAVRFTDGRVLITRNEWAAPSELYIRTWAALLLHFEQVLSGWYNAEHRDHFHVAKRGSGLFSGDVSVAKFVQVGLRWSGFEPGEIDGVIGSATQAAFGRWWDWAQDAKLVESAVAPTTRAGMGASLATIIAYGRRPGAQPAAAPKAGCYWEGVGEVPYREIDGTAYVPLRIVAEGLGFEVDDSAYPRIGVSPPT